MNVTIFVHTVLIEIIEHIFRAFAVRFNDHPLTNAAFSSKIGPLRSAASCSANLQTWNDRDAVSIDGFKERWGRLSGVVRTQPPRDLTPLFRERKCLREVQHDTPHRFLHPHAEFDESLAQRADLRSLTGVRGHETELP